eukprot:UN06617
MQPQYTALSSTTKQSTVPTQMIPTLLNINTLELLQNRRDEERLNPQFQQEQKLDTSTTTMHKSLHHFVKLFNIANLNNNNIMKIS